MKWYLKVLSQYSDFGGRARRAEYWYFVLFNILFSFVAVMIDNIIGMAIGGMGYGLITIIYSLALFIPSLAVGIRRLHDTGKSGWYILLGLIPIVGGIIILVFLLMEGDRGENAYGPDPKLEEFNEMV